MSSSSSTPASLTPQSTGTQDTSLSNATGSYRKPQVAFYPHVNSTNKPQKPFSRSAAKRESVMALGSIEHLQHYFTKTGIAAKKEATQNRKTFVPAIGGLHSHIKNNLSIASVDLPPSPSIPQLVTETPPIPHVRTYETDPENLRPGAIEDLIVAERMWHLDTATSSTPLTARPPAGLLTASGSTTSAAPTGPEIVDVLGVLKTTTRAVRSVRNYLLSLPDDSHGGSSNTGGTSATMFPNRSSPARRRMVSRPDDPADPLTLIRRGALEVLSMLRALEEACRVPLSDDAYDAQSDGTPSERVASPEPLVLERSLSRGSTSADDAATEAADASFAAFTVMQVPGRSGSILVWEEEEDEFRQDSDEERPPRERWDERLVLGSGWLYRQDITLATVAPEQAIVARYLDAVDSVLFGGPQNGSRGWIRERERLMRRDQSERRSRRVSAPVDSGTSNAAPSNRRARRVYSMLDSVPSVSLSAEPTSMVSVAEEAEEDEQKDTGHETGGESESSASVEDEDLPDWARRSTFKDDEHGRTWALLHALLPSALQAHLPAPREEMLGVLSSGQLLCVAYNAGVRRSRKPWGYIAKDAIHDIVALEAAAEEESAGGAKKSWTFRRTDNLRLWAAALKIRYLLPIVVPAAPLPRAVLPTSESSTSNVSVKLPKNETPVHFDARVVARREDGWEQMLSGALERWVAVVVEERRADTR